MEMQAIAMAGVIKEEMESDTSCIPILSSERQVKKEICDCDDCCKVSKMDDDCDCEKCREGCKVKEELIEETIDSQKTLELTNASNALVAPNTSNIHFINTSTLSVLCFHPTDSSIQIIICEPSRKSTSSQTAEIYETRVSETSQNDPIEVPAVGSECTVVSVCTLDSFCNVTK